MKNKIRSQFVHQIAFHPHCSLSVKVKAILEKYYYNELVKHAWYTGCCKVSEAV